MLSTAEAMANKGKMIRSEWNGFNLNSAHAAALDLGFVPESENYIESAKFAYLMAADDVNLDKLPSDAFVVYQGHHGDQNLYHANFIL
ncbi:NADH dehydrogenase [Bertholletia excelsa]